MALERVQAGARVGVPDDDCGVCGAGEEEGGPLEGGDGEGFDEVGVPREAGGGLLCGGVPAPDCFVPAAGVEGCVAGVAGADGYAGERCLGAGVGGLYALALALCAGVSMEMVMCESAVSLVAS